ncbi:2291_t:CDS:2, partial [Racocetra fulgida]
MPHPNSKSRIASSKPHTKTGTFEFNPRISGQLGIIKITDKDFQNHALKAIKWHQEADKKIKSAFYTACEQLQQEAKKMKTLNE